MLKKITSWKQPLNCWDGKIRPFRVRRSMRSQFVNKNSSQRLNQGKRIRPRRLGEFGTRGHLATRWHIWTQVSQKNINPRFTSMDEKILWALCTRHEQREKIVKAFDEWYGADIFQHWYSRVTNAVIDKVVEWQFATIRPDYPSSILIVLLVKIRKTRRVINKSSSLRSV